MIQVYKNHNKIEPTKTQILKIYTLLEVPYGDYSPILKKLIDKTKNVPITRHFFNYEELKSINNGTGDDIPRWEIKGYDDVISSDVFMKEIKSEFVSLWEKGEKSFLSFLISQEKYLQKETKDFYSFSIS